MGIVSAKEIVSAARAGGYAIGHFDIHNLEWTQAVLAAAEEEGSPVILGVTEPAVRYFGSYTVAAQLARTLVQEMHITVPVVLHLDHGTSVESCKAAIDAGFTSVMIDASHLPLEDNIAITKQVVTYAHARGVTVEAEVGSIGGKEDGVVVVDNPIYAKVDDCTTLVEQTGVDMLAPALGSVHGLYKGEPKLGFSEMQEIAARTQIPLVLHGSSGLSPAHIQQAIASGTAKINVNADNHLSFKQSLRAALNADAELYDATRYLANGRDAVKEVIIGKMRLFGSSGKA